MPESKSTRQLLTTHGVDPARGLSDARARELLESRGPNELRGKRHKNALEKFLDQIKDTMVLILLGAAVISFVVAVVDGSGDFIDSVIILAIVILNGVLGVYQESRAEKALDALKDLSAPTAKVLREGQVSRVPAREIVPGDVVLLEAGDQIPADGWILESASLQCEESSLTGESVPVSKDPEAQVAEDAPLGDRVNQVFTGCAVSYGRGKVLVTETGMETQLGRIANLLQIEPVTLTPLQTKLNAMGKYLGILAVGICAMIFLLGMVQGTSFREIFLTAVSLAVAAIPEGLTMVVTVVLALGVQRMVKRGAVIRKLPAVETLGSASVICSDKTGTLTQNRMTVQKVWPAGREIAGRNGAIADEALHLLRLGSLCCDGRVVVLEGEERHIGDPTETAIVAAALKYGLNKEALDEEFPRVAEIPFDSDRKLMTTVHRVGEKLVAVTKGGFDVLLPRCVAGDRSRAAEVNRIMAQDALRVLAVGCRELETLPQPLTSETLERDLTFMGLIGMIDPPREESRDAVTTARRAGIRTVMITGDHVTTASAIARDLGILDNKSRAISGQELAAMSQEELVEEVDRYAVYARVSPEDKIRIVQAWQARDEVVAMTGDGVNDAPALKAADIGCAMGITGTDVAKGAADMVLTDDNFSTIVEAVKGGRGIYENITRTIQFLLGTNLGEVTAVFFAMLLGWGSPLLAIHLLLINVVTDALPALALGVEPVDPDIMARKPVPRGQGIFSGGLGIVIVLQGLMVGLITLAGYYMGAFVELSPLFPPSRQAGMTMAFLVLAISQLVQAFNCRSRKSLFRIGFTSNKTMVRAFLGSLAVVFCICLIPPLEELFKMVDLSVNHWLYVGALSLLPFFIVEAVKLVLLFWQRRGPKKA